MAANLSSPTTDLKLILLAGTTISGNNGKSDLKPKSANNLSEILVRRLLEFGAVLDTSTPLRRRLNTGDAFEASQKLSQLSELQLQQMTADMSLWVIVQIQTLTIGDAKLTGVPDLGTRDLSLIRILLSVVFQWGIESRLNHLLIHWSATSSATKRTHAIQPATVVEVSDDVEITEHVESLRECTFQLFDIIFSAAGDQSTSLSVQSSHIGKILLNRYPTGLLKSSIALATYRGDTQMRTLTNRLLEILPISQSMVSLGAMTSRMMPGKLRSVAGFLLSEQLLRPGGLRGLFAAVFGEGDGEETEAAPVAKFEHVAKIVSTIPSKMNKEIYLGTMVPQILAPLGDGPQTPTPPPEIHLRAAVYTLSRILTVHPQQTTAILSQRLHRSFIFLPPKRDGSVTSVLGLIQSVLLRIDPSSTLPNTLVTPILPQLYSLLATLDRIRTSDPGLKELAKAILRSWGGCVEVNQAVDGWWNVIRNGNGWGDNEFHWEVSADQVYLTEGGEPVASNMLPSDLPPHELFQLRPEPSHLVGLLKIIKRDDVNSALLVRALNEYHVLQTSDRDPLRMLLYLKTAMEMVDQLGSTALTQPEHILSFVAVVLDPTKPDGKTSNEGESSSISEVGAGLGGLRVVPTADDDDVVNDEDGHDSDDEGPDDLLETALNLLLAVLEAHPTLTPLNTQLLQVISDHLAPLTLHASESVRSLAREARLVLTARNASTSARGMTLSNDDDPKKAIQDKYQQGLKFLQDPLLPVRAHGLLLLREIVVQSQSSSSLAPSQSVDPALIPSVLSIFLQAVQEDDSYIFLNAVQGLVVMVDTIGKEILKGLMDVYSERLVGGAIGYSLEKPDLDKRLRVGEALSQSIKKCGKSLPAYVDILVPPLFQIVRSIHLPITLRSSAVSVLAQCAEASPVSLLPWCADLSFGLLDLVQLESVAARPATKGTLEVDPTASEPWETSSGSAPEVMDQEPLSADPKLAPFRRSALHFLAVLLKSTIGEIGPTSSRKMALDVSTFSVRKSTARGGDVGAIGGQFIPEELASRLQLVLRYVRSTDVDDVVRVMAGEALELVASLQKMRLGLE